MMHRRRGISLIELLVVITLSTVLLGLSAGLIHMLMTVDRAGRQHFDQMTTLGRLSQQFRQDIRSASRAKTPGDAGDHSPSVELLLAPDRTVEYRVSRESLVRIERANDKVVRRETFRLHSEGACWMQVKTEEKRTEVSLSLERKRGKPSGVSREFRIEAVLDADNRFIMQEK